MIRATATLAAAMFASAALAGDPPRFVYVDLGGIDPSPFDNLNLATAINDAGVATGVSSFHHSTIHTDAGDIWVFSGHAFTAAPGERMVDISTQPEIDTVYGSWGWDINNLGVVVGFARNAKTVDDPNAHFPPVMWKHGRVIFLGISKGVIPTPGVAVANAINDHNQIVGEDGPPSGEPGLRSFLWENGQMRLLDELGPVNNRAADINNAGHIVGWVQQLNVPAHPYLLRDGKVIVFDIQGQAFALNELDQVVGWPGFIWEEGKIVTLPFLPSEDCLWPRDINDFGDIVGDCTSLSAVLWREGKVYKLQDLIQPNPKNQILWKTFGINERGQIVGTTVFTNGSGDQGAFRLDPVTPDFNGDGVVDSADMTHLLILWDSDDLYADLDGDGIVNGADLAKLLANWGPIPPRQTYHWAPTEQSGDQNDPGAGEDNEEPQR